MALPKKGSMIGNYRIEERIGKGGMGVVYRATHVALDKPVALKLIADDLSEDEGFRERFRREPRIAASIEHPHVIPVFDAGEAEGNLFVAMRYVDGDDLGSALRKEGALDPKRAAQIVAQVADALDAAHDRKLVHRDVKPANVLLESRGSAEHAYLTDFGITKAGGGSVALTRTGDWVGTADYVAPEQIEGKDIDNRTDIYALGAVLYHALSGEAPFAHESEVAKIYAHLSKDPAPVGDRRGVPKDLDAVIGRAMAKKPGDRYSRAGELGKEAVSAATGEGKLSSATKKLSEAGAGAAVAEPDAGATRISSAAGAEGTVAGKAEGGRMAGLRVPRRKKRQEEPPEPAKPAKPPKPEKPAKLAVAKHPKPKKEKAPAKPPTPEQEEKIGTPALTRNRLIGAGVVGVLLLAALGFVLGSSGGSDGGKLENTASTGAVQLNHPSSWSAGGDSLSIPGLAFSDSVALSSGDAQLVAGRVQAGGPALLPPKFLARLGSAPPRDPVQLANVEALRYQNLQPKGFDGKVTVFSAPTSNGVATVVCVAPADSEIPASCESIASTLQSVGAEAFPLGPDPAYADALDSAIGPLNEAKTNKIRQLGDAGNADGQAAALDELAGAYGAARGKLSGAPVSALNSNANGSILGAMLAARSAYEHMASAARGLNEDGYDSAADAARRAERRLRAALGSLRPLGYETG